MAIIAPHAHVIFLFMYFMRKGLNLIELRPQTYYYALILNINKQKCRSLEVVIANLQHMSSV